MGRGAKRQVVERCIHILPLHRTEVPTDPHIPPRRGGVVGVVLLKGEQQCGGVLIFTFLPVHRLISVLCQRGAGVHDVSAGAEAIGGLGVGGKGGHGDCDGVDTLVANLLKDVGHNLFGDGRGEVTEDYGGWGGGRRGRERSIGTEKGRTEGNVCGWGVGVRIRLISNGAKCRVFVCHSWPQRGSDIATIVTCKLWAQQ